MRSGFKSVLIRSAPTLVEDAAGCLALVVLLVIALNLPQIL
jgi:hypothetical protein